MMRPARVARLSALVLTALACRGSGTEVPAWHTVDVTVTVDYAEIETPASTAPTVVVQINPTDPQLEQQASIASGRAVLTFPRFVARRPFYQIAARVYDRPGGTERGRFVLNCAAIEPPSARFTLTVPDGAQLESLGPCR